MAGSDSAVTLSCFFKLLERSEYKESVNGGMLNRLKGLLYGVQITEENMAWYMGYNSDQEQMYEQAYMQACAWRKEGPYIGTERIRTYLREAISGTAN